MRYLPATCACGTLTFVVASWWDSHRVERIQGCIPRSVLCQFLPSEASEAAAQDHRPEIPVLNAGLVQETALAVSSMTEEYPRYTFVSRLFVAHPSEPGCWTRTLAATTVPPQSHATDSVVLR